MKKRVFLVLGLFLALFGEINAQSSANPTTFIVHNKSDVGASLVYMLNAAPQSNLTLKLINSNNQLVKEFSIDAGSSAVNKIDVNQFPSGVYSVELYSNNVLIHKETQVQIHNK